MDGLSLLRSRLKPHQGQPAPIEESCRYYPFLVKSNTQTTELLSDFCILHGFCSTLE